MRVRKRERVRENDKKMKTAKVDEDHDGKPTGGTNEKWDDKLRGGDLVRGGIVSSGVTLIDSLFNYQRFTYIAFAGPRERKSKEIIRYGGEKRNSEPTAAGRVGGLCVTRRAGAPETAERRTDERR